jgi:hypothetical protein
MGKLFVMFFSVFLVIMAACNSGAKSRKEQPTDSLAIASPELIDLTETDSIELYHYADPANQKAFYRTFIQDTLFIQQIRHYVTNAPVQKSPCANEFKLFFYRNGEVFKTIYAATADTCRYFAYVINGKTIFTDLNDSAMALLKGQLRQ